MCVVLRTTCRTYGVQEVGEDGVPARPGKSCVGVRWSARSPRRRGFVVEAAGRTASSRFVSKTKLSIFRCVSEREAEGTSSLPRAKLDRAVDCSLFKFNARERGCLSLKDLERNSQGGFVKISSRTVSGTEELFSHSDRYLCR